MTLLVLILLLGAGFRIAITQHAPVFIIEGDSRDFFVPGYQLAQDGTFPLRPKRAPGYAFFVAASVAAFGPSLQAVAIVQHVLGMLTIVLVYFIGTLSFGRIAGLIGALGAAINGALILMEHTIESEAVFAPLLATSMLLILLGLRLQRLALFMAAGLTIGLCTLARPVSQAILPLAIGAVLFHLRGSRTRVGAVGLLALGFGVTTGPWILRNYIVHGVPSISSGMGEALFERVRLHDRAFAFRDLGNPPADERRAEIRRRVFELAPTTLYGSDMRDLVRQELRLSEVEADAALLEASLQVIKQEPLRYLRGTWEKTVRLLQRIDEGSLYRFWETPPSRPHSAWPATVRDELEQGAHRTTENRQVVETLTWIYRDSRYAVPLLVLFSIGSVRCLFSGRSRGAWLLPVVVISQLALYVSLSGPLARFRQPFQPLITLVAAGGLILVVGQVHAWMSRVRLDGFGAFRPKLPLTRGRLAARSEES